MRDVVAVIQPLVDGWERGNFRPRPDVFAPDMVLTGFTPSGNDRVRGPEEIGRYLREFFAEWADYRMKAERIRQLDDEHVLIEGRQLGRGRTSGMDIDADLFVIVAVRDDRVHGIHWHLHRDGAFAAAGIEDPTSP